MRSRNCEKGKGESFSLREKAPRQREPDRAKHRETAPPSPKGEGPRRNRPRILQLGQPKIPLSFRVARTLTFGPSARASGRQTIVECEEFKTGDLIQAGLGKPVFADTDLSIGLNQKDSRHKLQAIVGRDGVRVVI
jgi:hypothetical protein